MVATFFGSGLLRPAPGTWGSLAAVVVAGLLMFFAGALAWPILAGVFGIFLLAGFATYSAAERYFGRHDPGGVVVDEACGVWLGLLLLPPLAWQQQPWFCCFGALLLFRLFDILKPWPIPWLEALPGASGVMADDLLAGLATGLVLLPWVV